MRTLSVLKDEGYEVGRAVAYRACRRPSQRPRVVTGGGESSGGGSSNGTRYPRMFHIAGDHIAWTTVATDSTGPLPPWLGTIDLAAPPRRATTFDAGTGALYNGRGFVSQLVIAVDGTIAWILDPHAADSRVINEPALLFVRAPSAATQLLDTAPAAAAFGALTLSQGGDHVSWTNDGNPRDRQLRSTPTMSEGLG